MSRQGQANDILAVEQGQGATVEGWMGARVVPQPLPQSYGNQFKTLTGRDVSHATVAENPLLPKFGKRGVALKGERIELETGGLADQELVFRELTHIAQQTAHDLKPASVEQLEAESRRSSGNLLRGKTFQLSHASAVSVLFEGQSSPTEASPANESLNEDPQREGEPIQTCQADGEESSKIDPALAEEGTEAKGLSTFNKALTAVKTQYGTDLDKDRLSALEKNFADHLVFYPSRVDFIARAYHKMITKDWFSLDVSERKEKYKDVKISFQQAVAMYRHLAEDKIHIPTTASEDTFGHEILHFLSFHAGKRSETNAGLVFHDDAYKSSHKFPVDLEEAITVYFTAQCFAYQSTGTERADQMTHAKEQYCEPAKTKTIEEPCGDSLGKTCSKEVVIQEICGEYYYAYTQLLKYLEDGVITEVDLKEYYFKRGPKKDIVEKLKAKYANSQSEGEYGIPLSHEQHFSHIESVETSEPVAEASSKKVKSCPTLSLDIHGNLRSTLVQYRKDQKLANKYPDINDFAFNVVKSPDLENNFKLWLRVKSETIQNNVIDELELYKASCK